MNNSTKLSQFNIKDLESLSGVKAHTIRIWEKRYNLLRPNRSETNIRSYSVKCLQKLLNVSLLNNNGIKISNIAVLTDSEILLQVKELSFKETSYEDAMNSLKIAMLKFDKMLFNSIYNSLLAKMSFREIIANVFFPFLQKVGFMWQVDVIKPIHEHFIANLIVQKIQINTEKIDYMQQNNVATYVLFLPQNEVYQIGLLYLNYELILRGFKTMFLGQNVPIDNLDVLINKNLDVKFVSCLTVVPEEEEVESYLDNIQHLFKNSDNEFIVFGKKIASLSKPNQYNNISCCNTLIDVINLL